MEEQGTPQTEPEVAGAGGPSSPRSYVSLTFPRNISFHCILGTVSFSHEDKLLTGKYVKTVLYQGRTFYIVVYKLRASNKNSWPRQED